MTKYEGAMYCYRMSPYSVVVWSNPVKHLSLCKYKFTVSRRQTFWRLSIFTLSCAVSRIRIPNSYTTTRCSVNALQKSDAGQCNEFRAATRCVPTRLRELLHEM